MLSIIGDELTSKPASNNIVTFGCYKGKTYQWIFENDGPYWAWCMNNIPWFKDKVNKIVN